MASWILVNISSGNGLVSDGTRPFPESMFELSSMGLYGMHLRAILDEEPENLIRNMNK